MDKRLTIFMLLNSGIKNFNLLMTSPHQTIFDNISRRVDEFSMKSSSQKKNILFDSIFRGRKDVL